MPDDEGVMRQRPDGSWEPAEPLPFFPGIDIEEYADGHWVAYDGFEVVAKGRSRFKFVRRLQQLHVQRVWGGRRARR